VFDVFDVFDVWIRNKKLLFTQKKWGKMVICSEQITIFFPTFPNNHFFPRSQKQY